ncbi:MAG: hypothetical protein AAGG44_21080 [Planctomycetota bacterium]
MNEQPKRQIAIRDILVIVVVVALLGYVVFQNMTKEETPVVEESPADSAPAGLMAQ